MAQLTRHSGIIEPLALLADHTRDRVRLAASSRFQVRAKDLCVNCYPLEVGPVPASPVVKLVMDLLSGPPPTSHMAPLSGPVGAVTGPTFGATTGPTFGATLAPLSGPGFLFFSVAENDAVPAFKFPVAVQSYSNFG